MASRAGAVDLGEVREDGWVGSSGAEFFFY